MKPLTFIANHWAMITIPVMYASTMCALLDWIFDWAPPHMYQHTGAIGVVIVFGFWLIAPELLNKYRTDV